MCWFGVCVCVRKRGRASGFTFFFLFFCVCCLLLAFELSFLVRRMRSFVINNSCEYIVFILQLQAAEYVCVSVSLPLLLGLVASRVWLTATATACLLHFVWPAHSTKRRQCGHDDDYGEDEEDKLNTQQCSARGTPYAHSKPSCAIVPVSHFTSALRIHMAQQQ